MQSINKIFLIGRVGKDPETRYTPNGIAVTTFSLATSERFKGQDGEQRESTEWHNIVCWRKLAEYTGEHIKKGMPLYVEGKVKTRSWDGKDGKKQYRTEVIADRVINLETRSNPGYDESTGFEADPITDDDIPF